MEWMPKTTAPGAGRTKCAAGALKSNKKTPTQKGPTQGTCELCARTVMAAIVDLRSSRSSSMSSTCLLGRLRRECLSWNICVWRLVVAWEGTPSSTKEYMGLQRLFGMIRMGFNPWKRCCKSGRVLLLNILDLILR